VLGTFAEQLAANGIEPPACLGEDARDSVDATSENDGEGGSDGTDV
jgi:hypothetical protein